MTLYSRIYLFIFPFFLKKRMRNFVKTFSPTRETKILDVGGTTYNWNLIDCQSHITLLNLTVPQGIRSESQNIFFIEGNGLSLQYQDASFDIFYSNSVIEHVGTFENQIKFASELMRVGRQVWVQTPAYSFFFEPHLLTPFIHFLPRKYQRKLLRNFSVWGWMVRPEPTECGWVSIWGTPYHVYKEMVQLFPRCVIHVEKFLGFPKAYIAVRKQTIYWRLGRYAPAIFDQLLQSSKR